jgi:hypothetical protein
MLACRALLLTLSLPQDTAFSKTFVKSACAKKISAQAHFSNERSHEEEHTDCSHTTDFKRCIGIFIDGTGSLIYSQLPVHWKPGRDKTTAVENGSFYKNTYNHQTPDTGLLEDWEGKLMHWTGSLVRGLQALRVDRYGGYGSAGIDANGQAHLVRIHLEWWRLV